MGSNTTAATSNSGIVIKDGEGSIPSSVRADGSVRKEIRVRAGYKPPEDVEVYKNKTAEGWKNRGTGGVIGAEFISSSTPAIGDGSTSSTATGKNAKRKEARQKAAELQAESTEKSNGQDRNETITKAVEEEIDPEAEKAKEAKKLAKKLRQANELKDKKDAGQKLLPEQLDKVLKINDLTRMLDKLGFGADGERK